MRYPLHNRFAYWALTSIDTCLRLIQKTTPLRTPQRILLCNTAHLGDVILTTALLPVLKEAFPTATIGMLVGSWSQEIVKGHPLIDRYHLIDHWKISRRSESLSSKFSRYVRMRRTLLKELTTHPYDLAIDCGLHFPNMAPVLWRAHIPVRLGFSSAGFGPLLTHSKPWDPRENRSVVEAYFSLLEGFSVRSELLKPILPLVPTPKESYIVIHMGSGNPQKNWPETHWRSLVESLIQEGEHLVFTGLGEEENEAIERVAAGLPHTNLCNQLSWKAFTETIQKSALLVGTDSSAGHVSAAVGTPAVLLYTGLHPDKLWRPYGGIHIALTLPTPSQALHAIHSLKP